MRPSDIEEIFVLHRRELVEHLRKIVHCADMAAELVQEAYLRLLRAAALQPIAHPRGFLFRTATNLALDYIRTEKVHWHHASNASLVTSVPPESPSAEQVVAARQRLEVLREVITELPPRCRDAFILHKLYGLTYREIATQLGISQSAVEKHLIKGLLACRRALRAQTLWDSQQQTTEEH